MINSGRTGGSVRRLRIGFVSAAIARIHGRRDAQGLLDLLADAGSGHRPSDDQLPPYVLGVRAQVTRSTTRLRSRLLHSNRELVEQIYAESVRVVTQYTVRGEPAPAALARYGRTVGTWRSSAAVCRSRAQGLVDEANHLLTCYWDAAWTRARRLLEAPEGSLAVPERRPAGWLPGKAELDPTWHRLDDGLRSDRWYGGAAPLPGADPTAVEQALAILDTQAIRGGAARAGSGRG
ncbi:hypothetical protein E0500_010275 [Streptomyces sp. KM273126]|uniref:hypothetical protein n=1 Tax=Streptomyces sp. KM273126 TaxID=2545247 RepID=UPI00103F314F|nr:hypothetical protein [Streptomyces sp. KM273126]MBA2807785.1 hypothetical protein [Streptomyces sp. KM273126]